MKHIAKGDAPPPFRDWLAQANEDWQPTWDNLGGPPKRSLRAALLTEQGGLCCYCNDRIGVAEGDFHIEHLASRSEHGPMALAYENLLASCMHKHQCGDAKADDALPVTPLQLDCERLFQFAASGKVSPAHGLDAILSDQVEEAIQTLNLNAARLNQARSRVMDILLVDNEVLPSDELAALVSKLAERDAHGNFTPFGVAIAQVATRLISPDITAPSP